MTLRITDTPNIITEDNTGMKLVPITDMMLSHREVECIGEIDADTACSLYRQLLYLQHADPDREITLFVNSPGGEVSSGLAIYDVIQSISCPVRTVCIGMAASMAALIFISGNTREMLPHSQLMIHDPSIHQIGGNALQMKAMSESLMRTREILANLIASRTGLPLDKVYELTSHDTYFEADSAVEIGLADSVISKL